MRDLVKRMEKMDSKEQICKLVDDLLKDTQISKKKKKCLQQVKKSHCKTVLEPLLIRNVQQEAKTKIIRFLQSVLFKKKPPQKREVISYGKFFHCNFLKVEIPFPKRVPKKVSTKMLDLIKDFETNNVGVERDGVYLNNICDTRYIKITENSFKSSVYNPRSLINWNMTLSNFSNIAFWVGEQERFIQSLDWEHKLIGNILSYSIFNPNICKNSPWMVLFILFPLSRITRSNNTKITTIDRFSEFPES